MSDPKPNLKPPKSMQQEVPKPVKRRKGDPFWPIVVILSILAFTGSFWFFYMLTSKINTKEFPTTDTPKLMLTPTPKATLAGTHMVGDGDLPSPTPSATATPPALINQTPVPTPSASVVPTPTATPVSTALPVLTPPPITNQTLRQTATPRPESTPKAAVKATSFKVQVGSFQTRESAQKTAGELTELGYSAVISDDGGKYHVQLGSYQDQESALSLAEEVTQRGYAVVVRKVEL